MSLKTIIITGPEVQGAASKVKAAAIIVAAGNSTRFGSRQPKQFVTLNGKPVFAWSIEAFKRVTDFKQIILVVPETKIAPLKKYRIKYGIDLVAGGKERIDSVKAGLSLVKKEITWVAIHDAARPLIRPYIIRKALAAAVRHKAAVVAIPCRDTVKTSRNGKKIDATLRRNEIWLAQTPQVFYLPLLRDAYDKLKNKSVTDDAQVIEQYGADAAIVPGDYTNIKITEPTDLEIIKSILRNMAK